MSLLSSNRFNVIILFKKALVLGAENLFLQRLNFVICEWFFANLKMIHFCHNAEPFLCLEFFLIESCQIYIL
jgi:hypothetical protein